EICNHLSAKAIVDKLAYSYIRNGIIYSPKDNSKFINHSDEPNIAFKDDETMIAIRDIHSGEEILENYVLSYDENDFFYLFPLENTTKEFLLNLIEKTLSPTTKARKSMKFT